MTAARIPVDEHPRNPLGSVSRELYSNDDGDGIGLIGKRTTAHFFARFFAVTAWLWLENPQFHALWRT